MKVHVRPTTSLPFCMYRSLDTNTSLASYSSSIAFVLSMIITDPAELISANVFRTVQHVKNAKYIASFKMTPVGKRRRMRPHSGRTLRVRRLTSRPLKSVVYFRSGKTIASRSYVAVYGKLATKFTKTGRRKIRTNTNSNGRNLHQSSD